MTLQTTLANISAAARADHRDHIDVSRAVEALCQSYGLDIYWGTGYAIEGDHAVICVRRGETFGHLTVDGETHNFWFR